MNTSDLYKCISNIPELHELMKLIEDYIQTNKIMHTSQINNVNEQSRELMLHVLRLCDEYNKIRMKYCSLSLDDLINNLAFKCCGITNLDHVITDVQLRNKIRKQKLDEKEVLIGMIKLKNHIDELPDINEFCSL